MDNEREDRGKVPDDFPRLRWRSRLYFIKEQRADGGKEKHIKGGNPYMPYYRAKDVWKWFKQHGRST